MEALRAESPGDGVLGLAVDSKRRRWLAVSTKTASRTDQKPSGDSALAQPPTPRRGGESGDPRDPLVASRVPAFAGMTCLLPHGSFT
jgi:hypothetical protein